MGTRVAPVVDVDWLRRRVGDVLLYDVRWYLDGRSGRMAFRSGHLPGAVFIDLDRWLAAPASAEAGRHPLPEPHVFEQGLRRAGADDDTTVVAYDDAGGAVAARLVWMLRATGHDAALLDGGLHAWPEPLSTVAPVITPGTFTCPAWPSTRLADADDIVRTLDSGGSVIDARAPQRYAGMTEPVDPRAGHIPGAINLPSDGNLDPHTKRFIAPDVLHQRYAPHVDTGAGAIVYCGSGVTACHDLLAMEHAGLPAGRLYPGSWSQWSADPSRRVATGSP